MSDDGANLSGSALLCPGCNTDLNKIDLGYREHFYGGYDGISWLVTECECGTTTRWEDHGDGWQPQPGRDAQAPS